MSRLTKARAGIPSVRTARRKPMNPRKRTNDGRLPLFRDWREGEPLIARKVAK